MGKLATLSTLGLLFCATRAEEPSPRFEGVPSLKIMVIGDSTYVYDAASVPGVKREKTRISASAGSYYWANKGMEELFRSEEGGQIVYRTKDRTGTIRIGTASAPVRAKDAKGNPAVYDYMEEEVFGSKRTTYWGMGKAVPGAPEAAAPPAASPAPPPAATGPSASSDADFLLAAIGEGLLIGKWAWTRANLDVDTFANGDKIPHAASQAAWDKARKEKTPAWCHYGFDAANGAEYGKLYNHYAIKDSRGLAPAHWSIPSSRQLESLSGTPGLFAGAGSGTGPKGFAGKLGGYVRDRPEGIGKVGKFWSKDAMYDDKTYHMTLAGGVSTVALTHDGDGLSIRCVKDPGVEAFMRKHGLWPPK